jgi:hypothetical protein
MTDLPCCRFCKSWPFIEPLDSAHCVNDKCIMHDTPLTFAQWRAVMCAPEKKPEPDIETAQVGDFVYVEGWNDCVDAWNGGGSNG